MTTDRASEEANEPDRSGSAGAMWFFALLTAGIAVFGFGSVARDHGGSAWGLLVVAAAVGAGAGAYGMKPRPPTRFRAWDRLGAAAGMVGIVVAIPLRSWPLGRSIFSALAAGFFVALALAIQRRGRREQREGPLPG